MSLVDRDASKNGTRIELKSEALIVRGALADQTGRAICAGQLPGVGDPQAEAHAAILTDDAWWNIYSARQPMTREEALAMRGVKAIGEVPDDSPPAE
jgi:hypothetical protein